MSIGSILVAKELAESYQPLLLCEFAFKSGRILRTSTHPLSNTYGGTPSAGSYEYSGHEWLPRIINQGIGTIQAMSDLGVDMVPQLEVVFADPDKTMYSAWEANEGFRGATLTVYAVMWDAGDTTTGSFSSDAPALIKFVGTCGSASFDDRTLSVVATSRLNMSQASMPPIRVQPVCGWAFPTNAGDRDSAANDPASPFFECGYSYGVTGGVGNPETGTAAFVSCDFSFHACIDRLGDSSPLAGFVPIERDQAGHYTGRFGGFTYIPNQNGGLQRPYLTGKWEQIVNVTNETKYGDFVPMCYGTTWIEPLVMGVASDGNYTYFEVLLAFGEISRIHKVVVNGTEVQRYFLDADDGHRDPANTIPSDSLVFLPFNGTWSTVNQGFRNGTPNPGPFWGRQGDPYGSMAAIYIKVLRSVAQETAIPSIQVLLDGAKIKTYTDVDTSVTEFTRNPAWILLDVLKQSGWNYSEVDLQSFIDSAAKCDEQIFFNRMDGVFADVYNESSSPVYPRFSSGFAVRQRVSVGELVRGIRASMKASLFFNYLTGKLSLIIKESLASQQSAPIDGSNYNTAVTSVTVEGVAADGYVAYSFDHTNIRKDDSGKSTLSVSQRSNQEAFNKITIPIQNRENAYSQDSATVVDTEDVSRVGTEVIGSFSVYGVETFDHARRLAGTLFAETYRGNGRFDYRGSAIGDTGGTLLFDFETTIKAIHLSVGQLCLISDQQLGIDQQLARVIRIQPSSNFEIVKITLQWHNDNWYQDSFGQLNQPIYSPAQGLPNRPPYCWRPGQEAPAPGDAYYDQTDFGFSVGLKYAFASDGSIVGSLLLTGKIPVNSFDPTLNRPKLEVLGEGTTGGGYPTDRSYWVTVAEKGNTASLLSPGAIPRLVPVADPDDALSIVAQLWPNRPTGYVAFAGFDPSAMSFQEESTTANPSTVVFDNNPYNVASWGPPDEVFSKFNFRISKIRHGGVAGTEIAYGLDGDTLAHPGVTGTVGYDFVALSLFHNYTFDDDSLIGRELAVYGLAARSDGDVSTPIPRANFNIVGNHGDFIYVDPGSPTACVMGTLPLMEGDVVIVRSLPTYGSDEGGNYFEDPLWVNCLNPIFNRRIISKVSSDTSPILITLDLSDGSDFPFNDGDPVVVQDVQGIDSANGFFTISNCDPINGTLTLDGSDPDGIFYIRGGWIATQDRGLAPGVEVGNLAFVVAGTGQGTFVKIKDNTNTRIYIDGDWPVEPDSTTRIIVVEPAPVVDVLSTPIRNNTRELVSTQEVQVSNYDRVQLLIQVGAVSTIGRNSPNTLDPFREIYMVGSPLTQDIPGVTPFQVRSEGYATFNVINLSMDDNSYAVNGLKFLAPSLDETDVGLWWYASVTASMELTPFEPFRPPNMSRFGTEFADNDYVFWLDSHGGFEVNRLRIYTDGNPPALIRQDPLALPGTAFFGSAIGDHFQKRLYKVIPKIFPNYIRQNALGVDGTIAKLPPQWEFPWANKCVLAVVSQPDNNLGQGPTYLQNLMPSKALTVLNHFLPSPGLRTMNGSAYTNLGISGPLTIGQTADFRVQVQAIHTIRCATAVISEPATDIVRIHLVAISPNVIDQSVLAADPTKIVVGWIDTLIIKKGDVANYNAGNRPIFMDRPYYIDEFRKDEWWPPTELAVCNGAIDANGKLLPLGTSPGSDESIPYNANAYFTQDWFLDIIVDQDGGASDLIVTLQA